MWAAEESGCSTQLFLVILLFCSTFSYFIFLVADMSGFMCTFAEKFGNGDKENKKCRELFDRLAIVEHETEWTQYLVLRFDFSGGKYETRIVMCNQSCP